MNWISLRLLWLQEHLRCQQQVNVRSSKYNKIQTIHCLQYFVNLGYNNYCIVPRYTSSLSSLLLLLLSLLSQGTPPPGQLVPQPLHLIFVWKRARFDFLTFPPPKAKLCLPVLFCTPKITINYFFSPSRTLHWYNPPRHRGRLCGRL